MQANEKHIFYCSCQFPFARSTVISLISYADVSRLPFLPRKMLFNVFFFSFDIPHVGKFLSGTFYIFIHSKIALRCFWLMFVEKMLLGVNWKKKYSRKSLDVMCRCGRISFRSQTRLLAMQKSVNLTNIHWSPMSWFYQLIYGRTLQISRWKISRKSK